MTVNSKRTVRQNSAREATAQVFESTSEQVFVPYDENLLERARTQWQFGDWQNLAQLDRDAFQHHPDRAKLALLAAAGRLQIGEQESARLYIRLSAEWGCSTKLIAQILIAGVHNSLGRVAAIIGQQSRSVTHFESSIAIGTPGADVRLLGKVRIAEQLNQLKIGYQGGGGHELNMPLKEKISQQGRYLFHLQLRINKNTIIKLGFNTKIKNFIEVDNGTLVYRTEGGGPTYLVSNESGDFEKAPSLIQTELSADSGYLISGKLVCSGAISPVLWIFQYSAGRKIDSQSVNLSGGRFRHTFKTLPNTEAVALGIRLAGEGKISLNDSAIILRETTEDELFEHLERALEKIRNSQKNEVQNSMKQIESFMRLQHYLGEDVVLPETHGWPISPDFGVLLINLIEQNAYDAVIEFGSGTSTLIVAKALQKTAKRSGEGVKPLLSFDHLLEYSEKTKKILALAGLAEFAEVVLAPLVSWEDEDGKNFSYYDCDEPLEKLRATLKQVAPRVLVIVDGPPEATGKHARYPALPKVMNAFSSMCSIDFMMDDYLRTDEQEIVAIWSEKLKCREIAHSKTEYNQLEKKACLLHLETCQGKK